MKKSSIITVVVIAAIIAGAGFFLNSRYHFLTGHPTVAGQKDIYYCPMHPAFTSDKPGECSICGMSLVKRQSSENPPASGKTAEPGKKRLLYYRNPMNPSVTSPVPMKDQMGMDYVPVYEETQAASSGVFISPEKQQLIGVKTQKLERRRLAGQILTVGIVAYDPDLFVAQQEYIEAIQTRKTMQSSSLKYTEEQLSPLVNAAKRKLLLLGMSEAEITELEKRGSLSSLYICPKAAKSGCT